LLWSAGTKGVDVLDWAVILTPLVVLCLLLPLGYVGCDLATIGDPPGTPAPGFYIAVKVPTALTVTMIEYLFDPPSPGAFTATDTNPAAAYNEGTDSWYIRNCGLDISGPWVVGCVVEASGNGVTRSATSTGDMVMSDGRLRLRANFWTQGTPGQGFEVLFKGSEDL
jgi:hypothetical protein